MTFQNSHFFLCLHPNFDFDFSIYFTYIIQLHSISHLKFPYITRQTLCNVSERTRTIRRIPVTTNRYKPPPQESGVYVWVLLRPVAFLSHYQHFSSSLPGTVPPLSYFPAIHIHPLLYAVLYKCCVRLCNAHYAYGILNCKSGRTCPGVVNKYLTYWTFLPTNINIQNSLSLQCDWNVL